MTPIDIMDGITALLAVDSPATIHRQALRTFEKDEYPIIIPYIVSLQPKQGQDADNEIREYDAIIRLECIALGGVLEDQVFPMILHIQKVFLTAPPYLDGWALDVKEGPISLDAFQRDKNYCAAALEYTVHIAYRLRSPETGPVLREVEPCEHLTGVTT